eukprot:tig00021073_g18019.t1
MESDDLPPGVEHAQHSHAPAGPAFFASAPLFASAPIQRQHDMDAPPGTADYVDLDEVVQPEPPFVAPEPPPYTPEPAALAAPPQPPSNFATLPHPPFASTPAFPQASSPQPLVHVSPAVAVSPIPAAAIPLHHPVEAAPAEMQLEQAPTHAPERHAERKKTAEQRWSGTVMVHHATADLAEVWRTAYAADGFDVAGADRATVSDCLPEELEGNVRVPHLSALRTLSRSERWTCALALLFRGPERSGPDALLASLSSHARALYVRLPAHRLFAFGWAAAREIFPSLADLAPPGGYDLLLLAAAPTPDPEAPEAAPPAPPAPAPRPDADPSLLLLRGDAAASFARLSAGAGAAPQEPRDPLAWPARRPRLPYSSPLPPASRAALPQAQAGAPPPVEAGRAHVLASHPHAFLNLAAHGYAKSPQDLFIHPETVARFKLREGDHLEGPVGPARGRKKNFRTLETIYSKSARPPSPPAPPSAPSPEPAPRAPAPVAPVAPPPPPRRWVLPTNLVTVTGTVNVRKGNFAFVRPGPCAGPPPRDGFLSVAMVQRYRLINGDNVEGEATVVGDGQPCIVDLRLVNGRQVPNPIPLIPPTLHPGLGYANAAGEVACAGLVAENFGPGTGHLMMATDGYKKDPTRSPFISQPMMKSEGLRTGLWVAGFARREGGRWELVRVVSCRP